MNLPNKLTVLRVILIPFFVAFYLYDGFSWHYLAALVVFALASLTDLLDGKIARARGLVTDFGKLMDPLADKLLVMSAMLLFIPSNMVNAVVVIVILAREFLVTSIRLLAAGKGVVLAADGWGKAKTVLQMLWICYGLAILAVEDMFPVLMPSFAMGIYQVLVVAVLALTVISGINYTWSSRKLFADM